jgi:Fe-S oxidoreductase
MRRRGTSSSDRAEGAPCVVFFYDTYIDYNDPSLGLRIVRLFGERNGIEVIVPSQVSSGLPALIEGDPDRGRGTLSSTSRTSPRWQPRGFP